MTEFVIDRRDAKAFMRIAGDSIYDRIFIGQGHIIATNGKCFVMADAVDTNGKAFVCVSGEFIRNAIKSKSNIIIDFEKMVCRDENQQECALVESSIKHEIFLKLLEQKPEEVKTSFLNVAGDIMEMLYKFSKDIGIHKYMTFKQISKLHTVVIWEKVDNIVGLVCTHSGFYNDETQVNDFLNELLSDL
nr:MAG TPA: hypothetical protein [Caudoviricetes sp.]